MLVYHSNKEEFGNDVLNGRIAEIVKAKLLERGINDQNEAEFRSWQNSMVFMRMALEDPNIPRDAEVAIEYQIPLTSKRVDFMIAGEDKTGCDNVVIIELKQWDKAEKVNDIERHTVRTYTGGCEREVAHPSYQAYSYKMHIQNYSSFVEERKIGLSPVAYCHNYHKQAGAGLFDKTYDLWLSEAPLFAANDNRKLSDFIAARIFKRSKDGEILYKIDHGKIRPAKALQDCLTSMVRGNKEFQLLDEQCVVYDKIMRAFYLSNQDHEKRVLIVKGGPGTGKSVLAVNVLCDLINDKKRRGFHCAYLTKNMAPRKVYLKMLSHGDIKKEVAINELFRSPFGLHSLSRNIYDCLLVDEAHRLMKQMYGDFGGENQIKECIDASLVTVFFIDESQRISVKDIGSAEEIRSWAKKEGVKEENVFEGEAYLLHSEFRCNGSEGYLAFLDDVLGIASTANRNLEADDFDLRIYDDATSLKEAISKKNEINGHSRLVAGYCYDWNVKNNRGDVDIVLDEGRFKALWNDPASNKTPLFAIDPKQKDRVGCIHTVQGLEFDYVGVIIGKDLRYEGGQIIADPSQISKDDKSSGIRGCKDKELAARLIKNTYKVLLTRGQKGCYVYCEDPALRDYLKSRIRVK